MYNISTEILNKIEKTRSVQSASSSTYQSLVNEGAGEARSANSKCSGKNASSVWRVSGGAGVGGLTNEYSIYHYNLSEQAGPGRCPHGHYAVSSSSLRGNRAQVRR